MYDRFAVQRLIDLWLLEDIGYGDLTVQLMIDPGDQAHFHMNAREPMRVAGIDVAADVFRRYDPRLAIEVRVQDGALVEKGTLLMSIAGPAQGILTAERVALNIAQRLSGIATETAKYVDVIKHTKARLIDTRKTTPGLRMLEKHAVTCGGGLNHRLGLDNGVMIIAVCGSIALAVERARRQLPTLTKLEVECDRLAQVEEALAAKADVIMLDNMSLADMRAAVAFVAGRVPLEASGGIRFNTIQAIAETGVDYISTSQITQSAAAMDIGLDEPV
jgi:nicotinate-nucleotide pyrophosphorylase (carboxylating)